MEPTKRQLATMIAQDARVNSRRSGRAITNLMIDEIRSDYSTRRYPHVEMPATRTIRTAIAAQERESR